MTRSLTGSSSRFHLATRAFDELQKARDGEDYSWSILNAEVGRGKIKKEHQVLMVNKTTKFKKGKDKKNFKKDGKDVAAPGKPFAWKPSREGGVVNTVVVLGSSGLPAFSSTKYLG